MTVQQQQWVEVSCEDADIVRVGEGVVIGAGRTDMDGEAGRPEIYREWVRDADVEVVVMQESYYPNVAGYEPERCRHHVPAAAETDR